MAYKSLLIVLTALSLCACNTTPELDAKQFYDADYQTNEMPLYGGEHDPTIFNIKSNSDSASKLGWQYYYSGDKSTAMKRFNQAWMFDRTNPQAYWGFGVIMANRALKEKTEKYLGQSIILLAQADLLEPSNGKIIGDLAYSYLIFGQYLNSIKKDIGNSFTKANSLFLTANKLVPDDAQIIYNWSALMFSMGKYEAAKKLLKQAKTLGFKVDPNYEKELKKRLVDE